MQKSEAFVSLKIGASAYLVLLAVYLVLADLAFSLVGRLSGFLLSPGIISVNLFLRFVVGARPPAALAASIVIGMFADIVLLSTAVLLLRRYTGRGNQDRGRALGARAAQATRRGVYGVKASTTLAIGLGISLALLAVAILTGSDTLFPYLAPGLWICDRLFGHLHGVLSGPLLVLGTAIGSLIFAVPVFIAQVTIAAWRQRRPTQ